MGESDVNIFRSEDFVFAEILSKLPAKSLMRFKKVCKSWLTRISGDSYFINAHLNQQRRRGDEQAIFLADFVCPRGTGTYRKRMMLLSANSLNVKECDFSYVIAGNSGSRIVGSSNGLVCLLKDSAASVVLWNPATREVRELPHAPDENKLSENGFGFGFGFDRASMDYKVVKLVFKLTKEAKLFICPWVFSRSENIWRGGEEERGISGLYAYPEKTYAVEANGALYWLACNIRRETRSDPVRIIMQFDLHKEVLRLVDAPGNDDDICCFLGRWQDSLTAFTYGTGGCVMWVATSVGGGGLRWAKLYNMGLSFRIDWFKGVWRNQCLVLKFTREELAIRLHGPDVASGEKTLKMPVPGFSLTGPHPYVNIFIYIESIVPVYN